MRNMLFTLAGFALLSAFPGDAVELPEHHKKLYGEGLWAKFQAKACESVKPVTATGTVRERGSKLLITLKEIAVANP